MSEEVIEKTNKGVDIEGQFDRLELFYEDHKKQITIIGGAILAVVALYLAFTLYYVPTQDEEAQKEVFYAEQYFEKDSFNLALTGGNTIRLADGSEKTIKGFQDIADEYKFTPTANLAHYYAGICLLRTGKYEEAIEELQDFSTSDPLLAAVAIGAMGDANMELKKVNEAVNYYLKAADSKANDFTSPIYLKKAGFAYETQGNYTEAIRMYERIQKEYHKSTEARDIEKFIARAKTLGNL
ncbi:MAG: tetratricopeptide repeat protein [Bacteroidetes bacterium]|nr:tetratricopeptide repeat protein [Bacteroidota bacterium]